MARCLYFNRAGEITKRLARKTLFPMNTENHKARSAVIERGRDPQTGSEVKLTKTAQVRMCGNSVSPPPAEALVRAQFGLTRAAVAA